MEFKENCEVNDVVFVIEGRGNKLIAHSDFGKVIIPINEIKTGYAKITEVVKIAENYILAKMENVLVDYYDDITYEEFKEVLNINGYKIGFEREFESDYGLDMQLLAYNLNNGVVLVAETYFGAETFNKIEVYCPNVNGLRFIHPLCYIGSSTMSILNLSHSRNYQYAFKKINELIQNKVWNSRDDISLWTYMDSENSEIKGCLWESTIDRILLADEEIEQILGKSKKLIPIFNKRKNKVS